MNKEKNKIKNLCQFYTKKEIAEKCLDKLFTFLEKINLNKKDFLFIEPSAGEGSFLEKLRENNLNFRAFDIEPKNFLIESKDFLSRKIYFKTEKKKVVVGNPPFGNRSQTAIKFFNKSAEFSEIIAFILPNHFKKFSVQSKLNKDFKLVKEYKLKKNSFYTDFDKKYNINCVFQIWTKLDTNFKNLRILEKPEIKHGDFLMFQYNNTKESLKIFDNDFDFGVLSQGYGDYTKFFFSSEKMDKKKQWILFKARNKKILKRLKKINFEKLSKENTTIPGFRKNNVVKEYKKLYEKSK